MRRVRKALAIVLTVCSLFMSVSFSELNLKANAMYASGSFNAATYSSDPGQYMASIALAQANRTGASLGYTDNWCAYFIYDCAVIAGQQSAISANGYVPSFYSEIMAAGGTLIYSGRDGTGSLSDSRIGDICFIDTSTGGNTSRDHVEIVYSVSGSSVSTVGGNSYTAKAPSPNTVSTRYVAKHDPKDSDRIVYIVRPNYQGSTTLPTNVTLSINTTNPHIGETVEFISSAQNVDSYTIGINLNGTRILTQNVTHYWYYKCEAPGNYTAFISANNSNGHTNSNVVLFTVEQHNYKEGYEGAHPHRVYMKCSCGAYYYTGGTTTMPGCLECSRPNKPSLVGLRDFYEEGETVTFNWTSTTNTTHYNLVIELRNDDGSYRVIYRKNYAASGEVVSFGEGYYRASVQSYNSNYWEADGSDWVHIISDYSYFQVNKPINPPVLIPLSGAAIDSQTHQITGLAAGGTAETFENNYVSISGGSFAYEYPTAKQVMGTGTKIKVYDVEQQLVDSYTVVIFGDIDGNSWYDGTDAYFVSLVANGLIAQSALTDAQLAACDTNQDGVIDANDVELLERAGLLLNQIDQNAAQEELETNNIYLEYCSLIDQTVEITESDQPAQPTEPAAVDPRPAAQNIWAWFRNMMKVVLTWFYRIFNVQTA